MSQYAKSIVAAVAVVLLAGIQSWQTVVDGRPFHLLDVLPIAVAVTGAFLTYLVPEVPELAKAKSWIAGAFAILTAIATFVSGHPADVTVLNVLVAGLGAVLTAYVPNLETPEVAAALAVGTAAAHAAAGHAQLADVTDALTAAVQLDPALAAKAADPAASLAAATPAGPGPLDVERQAVVDALARLDQLDAAAATAPTVELPAQPAPVG